MQVPYGVASDGDGHVYVSDHYNDRVSVFRLRDGSFVQHAARATRPTGLAVRGARHDRKLYVAHGGLRAHTLDVFRLQPPTNQEKLAFKCDV